MTTATSRQKYLTWGWQTHHEGPSSKPLGMPRCPSQAAGAIHTRINRRSLPVIKGWSSNPGPGGWKGWNSVAGKSPRKKEVFSLKTSNSEDKQGKTMDVNESKWCMFHALSGGYPVWSYGLLGPVGWILLLTVADEGQHLNSMTLLVLIRHQDSWKRQILCGVSLSQQKSKYQHGLCWLSDLVALHSWMTQCSNQSCSSALPPKVVLQSTLASLSGSFTMMPSWPAGLMCTKSIVSLYSLHHCPRNKW